MTRHRILIVEDDKATADVLADLVATIDCESIVIDNRRDAIAALDRDAFCCALLDLEIKSEPDSILRSAAAGASLVREVRERYPIGDAVWKFPILVVSGHAADVPAAVKVMSDGATYVIQKPFESRALSERILAELHRSGRAGHDACLAMPPRPKGKSILIDIAADQDGTRYVVFVRGTRLTLPEGMLRLLLRLIVGKVSHTRPHKDDLGGAGIYGFKLPSELRKFLEPAVGKKVVVIENDHHGHYWLSDDVEVGRLDLEKLAAIDSGIGDLAKMIAEAREPKV